jgi:transcription elongation GreA/GreB family factor
MPDFMRDPLDQISIKQSLIVQCEEFVQQKIDVAEKMMNDAQESANNETKSSAGDKFETGRAMMHAERDMNAQQLSEAMRVKMQIDRLKRAESSEQVVFGSVVLTSFGNYFISISAGRVIVDGEKYFAISAQTPLAQSLLQKKAGDTIGFNDQKIKIHEVF